MKTFISDWYGTSRLLASRLSSASIMAGSRSEIVRCEGFKFGSTTRFAAPQSTYPVESALPQKPRSWASDLNPGIFLRLMTDTSSARSSSCLLPR